MCEMCERPDLTMEDYVEQARDRLTQERFLVQGVLGSAREAEFSYSIGLTQYGLPELIVMGVRPDDATRLLHVWGDYLLDTNLVLPGETLETGRYRLEAVEVDEPADHLRLAAALYGPAVRALQLAWADDRGRLPWQPGHRGRRAGQPLLGRPAARYCEEHRPDRLDVPRHL